MTVLDTMLSKCSLLILLLLFALDTELSDFYKQGTHSENLKSLMVSKPFQRVGEKMASDGQLK